MFWKVIGRRIRRRRHYSVIDFPFGIPLKAESGGTAKGGQTSLTIFGNQFNTLLSSCFVHVGLKICEKVNLRFTHVFRSEDKVWG